MELTNGTDNTATQTLKNIMNFNNNDIPLSAWYLDRIKKIISPTIRTCIFGEKKDHVRNGKEFPYSSMEE